MKFDGGRCNIIEFIILFSVEERQKWSVSGMWHVSFTMNEVRYLGLQG